MFKWDLHDSALALAALILMFSWAVVQALILSPRCDLYKKCLVREVAVSNIKQLEERGTEEIAQQLGFR